MGLYLAVDIGASSGRHILGWVQEGRIYLEEIYRFENRTVRKQGRLCWDVDRLEEEILQGLEACKKAGKVPDTLGIDTWAVDYVLVDGEGRRLGDAVAYRDKRTQGMDRLVEERVSSRSSTPGRASRSKNSTPCISSWPKAGRNLTFSVKPAGF